MQKINSVIYISHDKRRYIKFLEILERFDFKKEVEVLRRKWNIDPHKLINLDDEKVMREWTQLIENPDLTTDVEQILIKLDISIAWMELVFPYVLRDASEIYEQDGTYFTNEPEGAVLKIDVSDPTSITLSLGKEFALNDLDKVKALLKDTKKFKTARREDNEYVNWKRDQKIFHMAKEGKTITEIATAIDKEYGEDISYEAIKTVVSNWYKRTRTPKSEQVELTTT